MSELPPAGWHPDPEAPGRLRYWEGTRWTEHVHTPAPMPAPAPTPTPAPAPPEAPASRTLITIGRKHEPVVVVGQTLAYKDKGVVLGQLVFVAHSVTDRFVNGSYTGTTYVFDLGDDRAQTLHLSWSGRTHPKKRQAGERGDADVAFESLYGFVYDNAVPPLLERLAAAIDAGGSVQIGKFLLTGAGLSGTKGLTRTQFAVPWAAVVAVVASGAVHVSVRTGEAKPQRLGSVTLGTPNGPLLRPLVRAFGGAT